MNVSSTHRELERIHAELQQALRDIAQLMCRYEISTNELEPFLRGAETPT